MKKLTVTRKRKRFYRGSLQQSCEAAYSISSNHGRVVIVAPTAYGYAIDGPVPCSAFAAVDASGTVMIVEDGDDRAQFMQLLQRTR